MFQIPNRNRTNKRIYIENSFRGPLGLWRGGGLVVGEREVASIYKFYSWACTLYNPAPSQQNVLSTCV